PARSFRIHARRPCIQAVQFGPYEGCEGGNYSPCCCLSADLRAKTFSLLFRLTIIPPPTLSFGQRRRRTRPHCKSHVTSITTIICGYKFCIATEWYPEQARSPVSAADLRRKAEPTL